MPATDMLANATMPANAAVPANCYANVPDQFGDRNAHNGNMAETELLCVGEASLHKQIVNILGVMS